VRILIIGGTRFIGPAVVRRLHDFGHALWLFHRRPADVELPSDITHFFGDRADLAGQADALRAVQPDVVIDMIPLTADHACSVMRIFEGAAGRVVAISSQDVYRAYGRVNGTEPGLPDPVPLREDSPLRERHFPYRGERPRAPDDPNRVLDHYEKILVEQVVMGQPSLPGTVLRLPMVYGPRDTQHRTYPYVKRMMDQRPAIVMNEQTAQWRWTRDYVDNAAAAIVLAVQEPAAVGRIYNVGEARALSTADWVRAIGRAMGWPGEVVAVPDYQLPEHLKAHARLEQELVADTARIREELGFIPLVSREEAIRRTVMWQRANPPEQPPAEELDYATEDAILTRLRR
jgi:nucleoside-diphosphate-sugar epimerase